MRLEVVAASSLDGVPHLRSPGARNHGLAVFRERDAVDGILELEIDYGFAGLRVPDSREPVFGTRRQTSSVP
jgi:hypothetical protein